MPLILGMLCGSSWHKLLLHLSKSLGDLFKQLIADQKGLLEGLE
jgi:hypothetical protein